MAGCRQGGGVCRPPRLPSVLCAILCCGAYATALLSGVTCTFLRVLNAPLDNAPIVADAPSEFYETAYPPNYSLGIYCPPPHPTVEVDALWLTARIFLSVGLAIGLINVALSLASCTPLISASKTTWKAMGVLSALAGSVQVPAFLMFDSSSCHHRTGGERYYTTTCQMDLGSFLLVCSVALQLCVTAFTQCVDAPGLFGVDEEDERKLDAWRKTDGRDHKSWDMSSVTAPGSPMSRSSSEINDLEIGRRQDEAMKRGGNGNHLWRWWTGCLGMNDRGRSDAGVDRGGGDRADGVDGGGQRGTSTSKAAGAVGSVAAGSGMRRGKKRKPVKRAKAGPPPPQRHVRSTSEGSRSVEVLKRSATQLAEDDDVEALELDQVDEEEEDESVDNEEEISQMRRSGPYDEDSGRAILGIQASPLRRKAGERQRRTTGASKAVASAVPTMASERTLQTSNNSNDRNSDEMNGVVRVGLVEQRRREVSARLLGDGKGGESNKAGGHDEKEGSVAGGVERAPPNTSRKQQPIQQERSGGRPASSAAASSAATEGRPPPSPRKASRTAGPTAAPDGRTMAAPLPFEGGGSLVDIRGRPVRREMATEKEMPPPPQKQSLTSRIASMFRGGDTAYDVMNDSGSSIVSSNASSPVVRNAAAQGAVAAKESSGARGRGGKAQATAPAEGQRILEGGSRRHIQMRLTETNNQTISMMDVVAVRQSSVMDMSVETVSVGGSGSSVVVTPSYDDGSSYATASEGGDHDGEAEGIEVVAATAADDDDAASEAPFDEQAGRPPSVGPAARGGGDRTGNTTSSPPAAALDDDDDGVASSVPGGAPSEVPFDELLDRARRGVALGRARAASVSASKTRGVGVGEGGGGGSPRSAIREAWRNNRRGYSVAPSSVVASASVASTTTPPRRPNDGADRGPPRSSTEATTPRSSKGPGKGSPREPASTPIVRGEGNNTAARQRGRSATPRTGASSSPSTRQRPREEEQGQDQRVQQGGEKQPSSVGSTTSVVKSSGSTPRRGRSVSTLRSVWERNGDHPPSSDGVVAPSPTNNRATPQRRRGSSVTPGASRAEETGSLNEVATSTSRDAILPSPSRRNASQSITRTPERRRSQSITPGSTRAAEGSGALDTAGEDGPNHRRSTAGGASPMVGRSAPSGERRGQSIAAITSRGQSVKGNNGPTPPPPPSRSVAPPGSPWARGGGQQAAAASSLTPSRRGRSATPRSRATAGATEGQAARPPPPSPRVPGSGTKTGIIGNGNNRRNDGDEEDEGRQSELGSFLDRLGKNVDAARQDGDAHGGHAGVRRSSAKLTTPPRSTPPPPPPTRTPGKTAFEKAKNESDYSEGAVARNSSAVVSPDVSPSSAGSGNNEIASPPRRHPPMPTSSSFFRRTNPSPSPNRYGSVKSYCSTTVGPASSPRSGQTATTIDPPPKGGEHTGARARVVTPERSEPATGEAVRATSPPPPIKPPPSSHGAPPPRYGSLVDARKQMFERGNHRSDDSSEASSAAAERRQHGSRSVSVSRRRQQRHVDQSPQRQPQAGGVAGRRGSSVAPQPRSEMDKVSIV